MMSAASPAYTDQNCQRKAHWLNRLVGHPSKIVLAITRQSGYCAGMKTNMTATKPETKRMWTPPAGWHKAATEARDAEAMYQALVADNARRKARGLPTFEPSYELAAAAIRA